MPKLVIDGQEIEVPNGTTVFQACQKLGKEIPHFCYHERLKVAGNCRMCLVEMEKSPKPIASCAMPVGEGMIIHTNTPKVQKAREGVMEFLLINHPLDCPICDQGGECDLQDQAFKYGRGTGRYSENKRSVKEKYLGPLIKTEMNRCIHCTRCIRFANDVAGIEEMGAIHRGEHMEVVSYLERSLDSELSGNMIDICPVGALTSKPYAFKARSWELSHTDSIDVLDAVGSHIRIDHRNGEIMRILPRVSSINEEWISDKIRFSYDGLRAQRLDRPYIRKNGKLQPASWTEAIELVSAKLSNLKSVEIGAIAGDMACVESMYLLKRLFNALGSYNLDANQRGYKIDSSNRMNYLFNTGIEGIEKADVCLLVGANPRHSATILNARIGQMQRLGSLRVARIGVPDDQTYKIEELGSNSEILEQIATKKHPFYEVLKEAKNPMIIVGDGAYSRSDGFAILALVHKIADQINMVREDWNGLNILHNHASMVGSLDIGFKPEKDGLTAQEMLRNGLKFLYLLGADEMDFTVLSDEAFIVYHGHHGDAGAEVASVIFPSSAYTEKSATYVNLEGRVQKTNQASNTLGEAMLDSNIITNLIVALKLDIPTGLDFKFDFGSSKFIPFKSQEKLIKSDINIIPTNYYMSDVITRASVTMAQCIKAKQGKITA